MGQQAPQTITVGALKQMLSQYDDAELIMVSNKSGDYWRTQLASGIDSIEEVEIEYSGYHNQFKLVQYDPDEEYLEEGKGKQTVLVLNLNQVY